MSTLQVNTIETNTPGGVLSIRDVDDALTAIQPGALRSLSANTAPVFQTSTGTEIGTLCRAWVACNGSSTILAGFNVSSITDGGVGSITVNFTNAMIDANYAATATNQYRSAGSFESIVVTGRTASQVSFGVTDTAGGTADVPYVGVAIFR